MDRSVYDWESHGGGPDVAREASVFGDFNADGVDYSLGELAQEGSFVIARTSACR